MAGLRFTHRGCGGDGEPKADGLMEETTLSGRITDFQAALGFLIGTDIDQARIGAVGSSFGGMVVLAAQDPSVQALALLATPYLLPEEVPHMPALGTDAAQYDLLEALQRYRRPFLSSTAMPTTWCRWSTPFGCMRRHRSPSAWRLSRAPITCSANPSTDAALWTCAWSGCKRISERSCLTAY